MRRTMTGSAVFAVVALFAGTAAPAEPGKPPQHGQPAAQPAKPAHPAPPDHKRGDEKPGKADEASRGKSASAHEAAPGQDPARTKNDEKKQKDEAAPAGKEKSHERGQTREKRRRDHKDRLSQRHGADVLQRPAILAELKTHAWRMARLERVRELAEGLTDAGKRKKTLERVDKLIAREESRHDRQLEHLKGQAGPGKPADPGSASDKRADKAGGGE